MGDHVNMGKASRLKSPSRLSYLSRVLRYAFSAKRKILNTPTEYLLRPSRLFPVIKFA